MHRHARRSMSPGGQHHVSCMQQHRSCAAHAWSARCCPRACELHAAAAARQLMHEVDVCPKSARPHAPCGSTMLSSIRNMRDGSQRLPPAPPAGCAGPALALPPLPAAPPMPPLLPALWAPPCAMHPAVLHTPAPSPVSGCASGMACVFALGDPQAPKSKHARLHRGAAQRTMPRPTRRQHLRLPRLSRLPRVTKWLQRPARRLTARVCAPWLGDGAIGPPRSRPAECTIAYSDVSKSLPCVLVATGCSDRHKRAHVLVHEGTPPSQDPCGAARALRPHGRLQVRRAAANPPPIAQT